MNTLVMLLGLAQLGVGGDPKVAVDWRQRESEELRKQIDAAAEKYAAALVNTSYSENGARTLQALGLLAVLPRLSPEQREKYRPQVRTVVKAERDAFWPGTDRDATAALAAVRSQSSYHLPLILLLLEHEQAGAVEAGGKLRDRELRFGIRPAKLVRKDVVRLLALLLATSYQADQKNSTFAGTLEGKAMWGYRTFGLASDSCLSPSGLAAVGLSSAVFGLNVLDYDDDDYEVTFAGGKLGREAIRNRLVDVCTHLLFALASEQQPTDASGLKVDSTRLDVESFRTVLAANDRGQTLMRIEQSPVARPAVPAAIYAYRGPAHRGAYFSASAAYILSVASRALALTLDWAKDHNVTSLGTQYKFTYAEGHWTLTAGGNKWDVKWVANAKRRYSPLELRHAGKALPVDHAIAGALNGCVACMTVSSDASGRTLRGSDKTTPKEWMEGASLPDHTSRFAGLYAFAFYKASVATGDGYTMDRWPMWENLATGLARPAFVDALVAGGADTAEKAAELAFGAMTMTRSYRTVFPTSYASE